MAPYSFCGEIQNNWDNPLVQIAHAGREEMCGEWTAPWYPWQVPGAGRVGRGERAQWACESGGIPAGPTGWILWAAMVDVVIGSRARVDPHIEYVLVTWRVAGTAGDAPEIASAAFRTDPRKPSSDPRTPELEIVGALLLDEGDVSGMAAAELEVPNTRTIPLSSLVANSAQGTRVHAHFTVRRTGAREVSRHDIGGQFGTVPQSIAGFMRSR